MFFQLLNTALYLFESLTTTWYVYFSSCLECKQVRLLTVLFTHCLDQSLALNRYSIFIDLLSLPFLKFLTRLLECNKQTLPLCIKKQGHFFLSTSLCCFSIGRGLTVLCILITSVEPLFMFSENFSWLLIFHK